MEQNAYSALSEREKKQNTEKKKKLNAKLNKQLSILITAMIERWIDEGIPIETEEKMPFAVRETHTRTKIYVRNAHMFTFLNSLCLVRLLGVRANRHL